MLYVCVCVCVCVCVHAKSLQSCLTLCHPMHRSPSGFSVHRILQARILEWVAIPSPGDLPNPWGIEPMSLMSPVLAGSSLLLAPLGSHIYTCICVCVCVYIFIYTHLHFDLLYLCYIYTLLYFDLSYIYVYIYIYF